nr:MAG TPA: hypothetical protein [Caudoviricetes sp.]
MKEYLQGFQTSTIDCTRFGIDVAKSVIEEFKGCEEDDFIRGYIMGVKMIEERYSLERKGE